MFFQNAIKKSSQQKVIINPEKWRVCDKVKSIRDMKKNFSKVLISSLFADNSPKEELIVLFLAILELMKSQEVNIQNSDNHLILHLL